MNKHSSVVWANGSLVPWEEAKVHILSHAIHYGTGVFEGIRAYETDRGPAIFRLKEHVGRMFDSAKIYNIEIPYTAEQIFAAIVEAVGASELERAYIRPVAFWGYGKYGLHATGNPTEVHIAVWEWESYLGAGGKEKGIRAVISNWRKFAPDAIPATAKACGQYLSSVLSGNDARRRGYDEAILLDNRGLVAEGCGENIFMVKAGTLVTNDLNASILPGITRATILELAKDLRIPTLIRDISPAELMLADEVFFTGTAAEVTPVREINDRTIGEGKPGPVTLRLQREYISAVTGKSEAYNRWLTFARPEPKSAGKKSAAATG